jgi:hypothetical protein
MPVYDPSDIFTPNTHRSSDPHRAKFAPLDKAADRSWRDAKDRCRFAGGHERKEGSGTRLGLAGNG